MPILDSILFFFQQEHEKRLRESEEQMEMLETKYSELDANMQEMKSRLRQQQSELQSEQNNNAMMLKEMQQLLAVERMEKEELKIRLQEVGPFSVLASDQRRFTSLDLTSLCFEQSPLKMLSPRFLISIVPFSAAERVSFEVKWQHKNIRNKD